MEEKLNSIINSLSEEEKDTIYRMLWKEHLKEDVRGFIEETDYNLDDGDVDVIASRYVDDGEYDCNLSYWDNIENLIREQVEYK